MGLVALHVAPEATRDELLVAQVLGYKGAKHFNQTGVSDVRGQEGLIEDLLGPVEPLDVARTSAWSTPCWMTRA